MIPVRCRTNLDEYRKERWPTELVVRPMVGDRIRAESGRELVICSITHYVRKGRYISQTDQVDEPMLELYLHKPSLKS